MPPTTQPTASPRRRGGVEVEIQGLTRSCHEALILASLAASPRHGYQLALEIERRSGGSFRFRHGTLYPILHQLEERGLIRGAWKNGDKKRKRKSYGITAAGRRRLAEQTRSWRRFFDRFFAVLEEVKG